MEKYEEFNPSIELITDEIAKGPSCAACCLCCICELEAKGSGVAGVAGAFGAIGKSKTN